ncbi:hypothetical protein [Kiloniella antarctica]|uniref:Nucleotide modification associated domain-containing protein n=1 Tax=Kiloniella antarctica TaxID=1550907 RepID=A0ABW5BDW6_9PROT
MRIILSRKGFDSQYGGGPSPILPDGRIYSLPIPHHAGPNRFTELASPFGNLGNVIHQLNPKLAHAKDFTHLDPDLYPPSLSRHESWRPCFGQYGAAQQHLSNQGVCAGDLFLFFGWFRCVGENFKPLAKQPDLHVIFGWLQVDQIITVGENIREAAQTYPEFADHPHLKASFGSNNTLYTSSEKLKLQNHDTDILGGGIFSNITSTRVLTAEKSTRSIWQLPKWFAHPSPALSYHLKNEKWVKSGTGWKLKSAPKGQEFVINTKGRTRLANSWLQQLFQDQ